ncbi:hypothetical protein BGZ76_006033 [Entomortierella beljakovae]|nr:hypothetical protein BGZ76_006033 [Entomortierella beljakovae]
MAIMLGAMARQGLIHRNGVKTGQLLAHQISTKTARPIVPVTRWFQQQGSFLTRSIHHSRLEFRNKPSWGDLIPQPQKPLAPSYIEAALARPHVPVSGRRRFIDVSVKQEEAMSKEAYNVIMKQYGHQLLPQSHPYTQYVERIARRIVKAAGMQNLDWEFHVINSDEKNAFVLPGGKVFVFTGILPIAENENGLATVLGHEIAHQLARHSAEKLSFTKVALFIGVIASVIFDPSFTMQNIMMNLGMLLPFSRKCETEADQIGLQLMAQACFDPRESSRVWTRMASQERGPSLAFLNTHPASKDRIHNMEKWMPEAIDTYKNSDCATTSAYADMFNRRKLASW